ncbi:TniQ family protein [Aestuariispira insulae]|uniref:TniQ protein n=1 Tax=Aestuariispira insulae TaxID=1461337 RepID=A0A3D9H689_9PROT|nr:TniQ family protein [Aestuariispira insulae]RED45023.1 TniQ protein [Aestuariispira insulae]
MFDQWHSLWLGRPRPYHDELLSSWFTRIALSNGLAPKDLYPICEPGGRLYRFDLDRNATKSFCSVLAEHTGIDPLFLMNMGIRRYENSLLIKRLKKSRMDWFPPAGAGFKSYGQQYCPICLDKKATPYFKHLWRFSFITICPKHGCELIDRCKQCGKPIEPLRTPAGSVISCCSVCGNELSRMARVPLVSKAALDLQQKHLMILCRGNEAVGGYWLHSIIYFQLLMVLVRLLGCSFYARALQEHLKLRAGLFRSGLIPKLHEIEQYNPRCRRELLLGAEWLLKFWPGRFVSSGRIVEFERWRFMRRREPLPYILQDVIDRYFAEPCIRFRQSQIGEAAKTLSSHAIDPTTPNIVNLVGHRIRAKPLPNKKISRYWKLDGVSPEVKEAAKSAARLEGENIASWVEETIKRRLKAEEKLAR